jgi:hypothetical protein
MHLVMATYTQCARTKIVGLGEKVVIIICPHICFVEMQARKQWIPAGGVEPSVRQHASQESSEQCRDLV